MRLESSRNAGQRDQPCGSFEDAMNDWIGLLDGLTLVQTGGREGSLVSERDPTKRHWLASPLPTSILVLTLSLGMCDDL
jgi:hypothetical protein